MKGEGVSRREFVGGALAGAAVAAAPRLGWAATGTADADKKAVLAQIPGMHDENIRRLQDGVKYLTLTRIKSAPKQMSIRYGGRGDFRQMPRYVRWI